MNLKEATQRIEELEKRLRELEGRPVWVPYVIPRPPVYPSLPAYPNSPWCPPWYTTTTCTTGGLPE